MGAKDTANRLWLFMITDSSTLPLLQDNFQHNVLSRLTPAALAGNIFDSWLNVSLLVSIAANKSYVTLILGNWSKTFQYMFQKAFVYR